jgi:triosephosphate isomerase
VKTLIVGNWKMYKTAPEAVRFARELLEIGLDLAGTDAVVAPAFTALHAVAVALEGSAIGVGAQTMHWADEGAHTGEISPLMLRDAGAQWVILGHSERRAHGEDDAAVNRKVHAALTHRITPIVAVGENAEEHAAGEAIARVVAQTQAAFAGVTAADVRRCVVAYEPIWAIGSGVAEHPAGANATMAAIRAAVPGLAEARILYGGSVKPANIAALIAQPHINGALVGGASLEAASFAAIVHGAHKAIA